VTARRNQARHAAAQTAGDAARRPGWRRGRDDLTEAAHTDYAGYERPAPPADGAGYERPPDPPEADRSPEPPARQETRESWLKVGQMQFDYLIGHGLQPGDRLLEIGCGTLAAGHLFIDYLSTGNYYGIEFAPDALIAAQQAIAEFGLQAKLPHVTLAGDLTLGFLPASKFTVVQAPTVFLNAPIAVIGECLAHVTRVMTTDAIFDFAFDRTGGAGFQAFKENFYHRADTLIDLADYYGLDAELLKDWDQLGLPQSKIRITRRR
jgi:SAM-dependent methyltransferase